jgi:hypothetical protein
MVTKKRPPIDEGLQLIARYEAAIVTAFDERPHGGAPDDVAVERAALVQQARAIGDRLREDYRARTGA